MLEDPAPTAVDLAHYPREVTRRVERVLIIVQNLPVPFDRRVWLECQALTGAGYRVAVFWPLAMAVKAVERTKFVFDHHDLSPELFQSRFPDAGASLPYRGLRFLERRTHRSADHVISTNDSYRQIAIDRSGKDPADVTVVRTGPDPAKLQRGEPEEAQRRGRQH